MPLLKRYKRWLFAALSVLVVASVVLIQALAGFGAQPVAFAPPPHFVDSYADSLEHPNYMQMPAYIEYHNALNDRRNSDKITGDYTLETALLHKVMFEDESPELVLSLFAHPDKAVRVRIASAFAQMNITYSHDDESGYPAKRLQFWVDWKPYLENMENAMFEALVTSAEEETLNYIPYTIAWMPTQDQDTVKLLAWAAEHHPDPWVRRFSVYFVVKFGDNDRLARRLLESRANDPAYVVRKQVLELKYQRFTGEVS